ncbi:hypothetical protein [Granulicella tundricola]|uniref:Uncharacterized protein n=1 Tax=Granulicella tundricola (strain ATCC BAA-1859 / DSM 23138 / MP5ACTX9) TaxID=1198114 RepID=E8WW18_GRATM|nr:hypothetical protein [Granulicella tundricola]ADW67324.1 hypothetical protein AciX9_0250 [Granulicella tundricola MP5ACTX9]
MGTALAQLDEEILVREKIAELTLPDGVKFKRIEQMNDWTGDPSLTIYFGVSKRRPTSPKSIRELTVMTKTLRKAILDLGLGKFPFFRFEDAR